MSVKSINEYKQNSQTLQGKIQGNAHSVKEKNDLSNDEWVGIYFAQWPCKNFHVEMTL